MVVTVTGGGILGLSILNFLRFVVKAGHVTSREGREALGRTNPNSHFKQV